MGRRNRLLRRVCAHRHDGAPVEPWKAQLRICECRDTFTLQRHLEKLWESCPATSPLQVGVWLFNLVPDEQHSLSLFDNDERQFRLSSVNQHCEP
jgi:hypothetical protein